MGNRNIGFDMQPVGFSQTLLAHEAGHVLASLHYGATEAHIICRDDIIEVQTDFDDPPGGVAPLAIIFGGVIAERMWGGDHAPVANHNGDILELLQTPLGEHDQELVDTILLYSPPLDEAALWEELLEVETVLQRCLFDVDFDQMQRDLTQRGRALVKGGASNAVLH